MHWLVAEDPDMRKFKSFLFGSGLFLAILASVALWVMLPGVVLLGLAVLLAAWMAFTRMGRQAASVTWVGVSTLRQRLPSRRRWRCLRRRFPTLWSAKRMLRRLSQRENDNVDQRLSRRLRLHQQSGPRQGWHRLRSPRRAGSHLSPEWSPCWRCRASPSADG